MIKVKNILFEDFVQYKKPSMFIGIGISCNWKCEKDLNKPCGAFCQNSSLANAKTVFIDEDKIIDNYLKNPITSAIVFGGLEPMDNFIELYLFISKIREKTKDDIVIYTGYKEEELEDKINKLSDFKNIIIKFGRFVPNSNKRKDEVLGVFLASDNQYAKQIS